jgi:hypothetical protein
MRVSRNRNWGHPELVQSLERFAPLAAEATGWNLAVLDRRIGGLRGISTHEVPANREINREFFNFGPDRDSEVAIRPMIKRT